MNDHEPGLSDFLGAVAFFAMPAVLIFVLLAF